MASSKKPKEEEKNKTKKKSNSNAAKVTKKAIKKPDKKAITPEKPNKSKPKPKPKSKAKPKEKPKSKPENKRKKSSNGTLVESEVIASPSSSTESEEPQYEKNKANKNVKPIKRKHKEKVEEEEEEEEEAKICRFPMNRIKRIMKTEDSSMALPQDVVFLVNKATEKFLEKFCEDGYKSSVKDKKKSLSYKHLSKVVHERRRYDFLSDYVPGKLKAEDALKEGNLTETGAE